MFSSMTAVPLWYWAAAVVLLLLLLLVMVLIQGVRIGRVQKRYRQWEQHSGRDPEMMLPNLMERLQQLSDEMRALNERLEKLEAQFSGAVRTVKVVRYNAFTDTGSDLSFSAAWLDGEGNGVIISSIYGRDESRMYAKPVVRGQSSYPLSEEEKRVLQEALGPFEPDQRDWRPTIRGLKERL